MARQRQEVLNVILAQLLRERGVVSAPETIMKANGKRNMPDVIVDYNGLRTAIECEVADAQTSMVKKANRQMLSFTLFVAVCTAVLWLLILLVNTSRTELWVAVASLFSVVTLLLFESAERIQQTSQRAHEVDAGVEKLTQMLTAHLGEAWTLHPNVRLPDVPPVKQLLVCEQGVFALNIMNTIATHHVKGSKWHVRQQQAWRELGYSPSQEVLSQSENLAQWFADQGVSVDVRPRIAWMGSGTVLDDESAVPIWEIGNQDVMVVDIVGGEMTADHTQINALIKPYAD